MIYKLTSLLLLTATLSACSTSARHTPNYSIDDVYNEVNQQGKEDTVSLLRNGLTTRYTLGQNDPYYPIRTPEVIVPIWNRPKEHLGTGARISGHWEHLVVEESTWAE
jgi:hypothetical protein